MTEVQREAARRKRRGRPPVPPDQARSHRVVTFVTDSELFQLQSMSNEMDTTLSATIHRLLTESLREQRVEKQ